MDFLLNPNIAYLFLLGGVFLAMLALATPGTGFFEVGAFFCIALAGYAIYTLSINLWALVFVILSIVPFIYSLRRPNWQWFLGGSILVLAIGSIFLFSTETGAPAVNLFVALSSSTLVSGFLWIAVGKTIQASLVRPGHDLDALVGQVGV